jgi:hypothetical protein
MAQRGAGACRGLVLATCQLQSSAKLTEGFSPHAWRKGKCCIPLETLKSIAATAAISAGPLSAADCSVQAWPYALTTAGYQDLPCGLLGAPRSAPGLHSAFLPCRSSPLGLTWAYRSSPSRRRDTRVLRACVERGDAAEEFGTCGSRFVQ